MRLLLLVLLGSIGLLFQLIAENLSTFLTVVAIALGVMSLLCYGLSYLDTSEQADNDERSNEKVEDSEVYEPITFIGIGLRHWSVLLAVLAASSYVGAGFTKQHPIVASQVDAQQLEACAKADADYTPCANKKIVVNALVTNVNSLKEIEVCYRSNGQGSENIIDNCAVDASIKLSEEFTGKENEVIRIGFFSKSKSWAGTVIGERGNVINTVVSQAQVESIQLKNEAEKLGLPVHEVIARRKQEEECVTDWTRCRNNEQFVNVSDIAKDARYDCADEARKMARPRDLDLSLIPFSSYMSGVDYIKDGVALFIDPNASMENDFGAEMSVTLECYYSLNEMKVMLVNMR
ncbi:hypothetical protein C7967_1184 [Thalassospira sp. 11-3]|nr:hypothetical protein C7967_1184 [Thalassospira sp. 11-3]